MKQYKVTLEFTFKARFFNEAYGEDKAVQKAKQKAFERTDIYYDTHSIIDYVKENSAFEFVEYIVSDGEVISAEWDEKTFKIHMNVNSERTGEELRGDLQTNSLEDGEYEGADDAWVLMTRGKNGKAYNGKSEAWEYGLIDYRGNDIQVKEIGTAVDVPECSELFTLTPKGKQVYGMIIEASRKGIQLNENDEKKLWLMRELK